MEYSRTEQTQNRYTHHFKSINYEIDLPEDQFFCISILNDADIEDLEIKRRVQIADWIHSQASLWSKSIADKNKSIRKKEEWILSPISETRLCEWSGDCIRQLSMSTDFKPNMDLSTAQTAGIIVKNTDVLQVIATFFQLIGKCEETNMAEDVMDHCVRQHEILSTYLRSFADFLIVPQASPYDVVESRFRDVRAKRERDEKAKTSAAWLKNSIESMTNTQHLVSWLANLTPMSKDTSMTETGRSTICGNVKHAIRNYDWKNFTESTTFLVVKHSRSRGASILPINTFPDNVGPLTAQISNKNTVKG